MFHSARLKLTAWYLLIIMCISITFSMVIYRMLSAEFERFSRVQRMRYERRLESGQPMPPPSDNLPPPWDPELVEDANRRVLIFLVIINGGILIISGLTGYFLAGRTLQPIQEMVDEQNRFISDASHELRTPLTALKTSMEVHLRDQHLTVKDAKILIEASIEDVNKLQSLSDALLKLAQYEKPENRLHFETIQLTHLIEKSIKKIQPIAQEKNIQVELEKSEEVEIEADQDKLFDLFIILLDNAVKYSNKDSKVELSDVSTDGHVKITIKDHGVGIDEKDLPHIFDRFYRADNARSSNGYGLGLSIAEKIVQLHHGTIDAESKTGEGTQFIIRLPKRESIMGNTLSGLHM